MRHVLLFIAALIGTTESFQEQKMDAEHNLISQKAFLHPGLLHNQDELDFIREKVTTEAEPWFSGWKTLLSAPISSIDWESKATANVLRGAYNKPDIGASHLERDAAAIYSQAVQWIITGNSEHALKSIAMLNDWQ